MNRKWSKCLRRNAECISKSCVWLFTSALTVVAATDLELNYRNNVFTHILAVFLVLFLLSSLSDWYFQKKRGDEIERIVQNTKRQE